ncbi:MAG TPA: glycosyltransferase family 4 protein [Thermoanaerobaculia bacterium]|nr:glycosyltransferase family 4 protein [Thermoanaerobaculia bacterium]
MRVAVVSCVYPPEPAVSARTSAEIAAALHARGHDVRVICPFPSRPAGRLFDGFRRAWRFVANDGGVIVERRWSTLSPRSTLASRFVENLTFGITSAIALLRARCDAAYLNSWPLFATGLTALVLGLRGVPFVVSVQDVYPESLFAQRRRGAGVVGSLLRRVDRAIARRAAAVIVLSRGFAEIYERDRGVDRERVYVVPNWIGASPLEPDAEAGRAFRSARGIPDDAIVVAYGGNVGVAAGVEQLIEAFRFLDGRFRLVVAGSGSRAAACVALARSIASERIHFVDPWPTEMTATVLAAADLLALPTAGAQSAVSVPSKLLTYLLADKPILAIARADSEIARVLEESQAGVCAPPADPRAIADAIRASIAAPVRGGRAYALRHFGRDVCLPRVVEVIEALGA